MISLERQKSQMIQVMLNLWIIRTKESFERLLSNVLTRSYLGISNITMAGMRKKDWDGEVMGKKQRKQIFIAVVLSIHPT